MVAVGQSTKSKMLNCGLRKPNQSSHPLSKQPYQVFKTIKTRNFSALRQYGPHHNTESLQLGLTSCPGKKNDGIKKLV